MVKQRTLHLGAAAALAALLVGSAGHVRAARPGSRASTTLHTSTTLVYGVTESPDHLNPNISGLQTTGDLASAVFDVLVGSDAQGNFTPDLATSWGVSSDKLTYTFHLRHGVKWADGQPFTAKDVVFTYKQILNPKNNTATATGFDHITSADTPDNYTVVFHTKKVFSPFLADVGQTFILPAHYFEHSSTFLKDHGYNHDPFDRKAFGTGPYLVSEWKTADHITLVPNKYYWGQKPYFQKVIYKIVPSVNTMLVQLRTGEVQMSGVTQQQVQLAKALPGKTLFSRPGQQWHHIDLKQEGFLRDQQVRVALDYATPKEEILKTVLHGYGQVDWGGDIAPSSWAYNPDVPRHYFNLKTAAAMLSKDGFTKGSDGYLQKSGQELYIQLWYINTDAIDAQIDQILKYEWGQIGVKVDLHQEDVDTIFGPNGPQFNHQMTGVSYSWFNGNDPDDGTYWQSSQIPTCPTCAGNNVVAYFHKFSFQTQIDNLTNAGLTTVDRAQRKAIYAKVETLLSAQDPAIFLYWAPDLSVAPITLKGYNPNAFNHVFWNVAQWRY